jgi:hypothetical protein
MFNIVKSMSEEMSAHSLPVLVGVAELPAQPFVELYCHLPLNYYGYTIETFPICKSKALVKF